MENNTQTPWTRPWFIVAAGVLALSLLVAVVVLWMVPRQASGEDPAAGATASVVSPTGTAPLPTSSSPSTTPPDGDSLDCAAAMASASASAPSSGSTERAPGVHWDAIGRLQRPVSSYYGPLRSGADEVRGCFRRDKDGAGLAAVNAHAMLWGPTVATVRAANLYLLSPESRASSSLASTTLDPSRAATSLQPEGLRLQLIGYKVDSFSEDRAQVEVLVESNIYQGSGSQIRCDSGRVSVFYSLVWEGEDWRIQPVNSTKLSDQACATRTDDFRTWKR